MSLRSPKWLKKVTTGLLMAGMVLPFATSVSANLGPGATPHFVYANANPSQVDLSNPNSKAVINFQVDEDANVKLLIEDSSGKVVRTLYGDNYGGNTKQPPLVAPNGAPFSVAWDGKDDNNNNVPTASNYMYYLEADNNLNNNPTDYKTGSLSVINGSYNGNLTVSQVSANPYQFNPSLNQSTTFSYYLNKAVSNVSIKLTNANTTIALSGTTAMNVNNVQWDGRIQGTIAPAGYYTLTVTATDYNSNVVSATASQQVQILSSGGGGNCVAPHLTSLSSPTLDFAYNSSVDIAFTIDMPAKISMAVYDQNNNLQRTLYSVSNPYQLQYAGTYKVNWDGRSDSASILPNGTYRYQIIATTYSGSTVCGSDTQSSYITITNSGGNNNTTPVVSNVYANPTQINPSNGQTTTINYSLTNHVDNVTIKILNNGTTVRTLTGTTNQNNAITWDGRYSDGSIVTGYFSYIITATNNSNGATGTANSPAQIQVVSGGTNYGQPNITNLYATPTSFNPSNGEYTQIYYNLDKDAQVTVEVLNNSSNYSCNNNGVLRTLVDTVSQSSGSHYITWNGLDCYGSTVSNGTYTIRVKASNSYGMDTETTSVTVSGYYGGGNNQPTITNVYATPTSFNPNNGGNTQIHYYLNQTAQMTVEVLSNGYYSNYCNNSSNVLRTLVDHTSQSSGDHYITWNGQDSCGNTVNDGSYTIRLTASNNYGTDTETVSVQVNRTGGGTNTGTIIQNLSVTPTLFRPLQGEITTIHYNLSQNAVVTIQILNSSGSIIRTLVDHVSRTGSSGNNYIWNGTYTYADTWNGRDQSGNVYDGIYQVRVTAYTTNNVYDTKNTSVEVDTNGQTGGVGGTNCAGFTDVSTNNPYCQAITLMKQKGIFEGYDDGTFHPYQEITRAEATKVITLALNIPMSYDDQSYLNFSDTNPNAWYAPYLRVAKRLGIINGYPDGTFRPNNTINRVELLKIFLQSSGLNIPYCSSAPYYDTPVTPTTRWYINFVCFAQSHNLMSADSRGLFNPGIPMTRGDVANLFYQYETSGLANQANPPSLYTGYTMGY